MNTNERHYPEAYKLVIVALLGFAVYIFFNTDELMVRLYCVIMFIAVLNGWATSEDTRFKYGDLYLFVDAVCCALYFISLLELNMNGYKYFWVYSGIIFFMYWVWNKLMIVEGVRVYQDLKVYNRCDIFACFCSFAIFGSITYIKDTAITVPIQYFGMILWGGLLCKWYYDFYIRSFRNQGSPAATKTATTKGGKSK